MNGDGYDDLVTESGSSLIVRLNTTLTASGSGFGAAQTVYTLPSDTFVGFRGIGADGARGPERALHFARTTEAGLIARVKHDEVICLTDGCTRKHIITSYHDRAFVWTNGALAPYGATFAPGLASHEAGGAVVALDVNGDGLTDLVPSGTATLLLNTGSGFSSVSYGSSTGGLTLSAAVAADYSGNGRDDLLVPDTTTGDWMELASTGTGFAAPVDIGIVSGAFGATPIVGDTEGRMLADIIGVNGAGDIELALRHGPYPDLLAGITDGFGNTQALTWAPLSDAVVAATLTVSKNFELTLRNRYVLASDRRNNGIGGSYTVSYRYDTPLAQASAGFAGIRQITATDSRNGDTTTRVFAINKYDRGTLSSVTLAQASGDKIREDTYTYNAVQVIMQGKPLMLWNWTTTHYDQGGSPLYKVGYSYQYDTAYMPEEVTVTTTDSATGKQWITEIARTNVESQTTSDWCFDLANTVTVTDTLPSGTSASRETTYTPDLAHCRVSAITRNANLAVALQTATTFGYDAFGNVATVMVVGHNSDGSAMAARTTQYGYDNHGEFRTAVTDAAGDVAHAAWNGALGVETAETAVNGAVTSYAYDGFGRLTKTTLSTGASATVGYHPCSGSQCNTWAYYMLRQASDAGGSAAGESYQYYDRYGRRVEQTVERLGGQLAQTLTHYNALGQIHQVSAPFYAGDTAYWATYSYDALGRVTEIRTPSSTAAMATTSATYNGFTTTVNGPNGYTETVTKNPLEQVTQVTDAAGNTSTYTYAPFAELTQVKGADQATTNLTYDAAGHRTQLAGSDRGTLSFTPDSLGEVTTKINARNQTITLGYDRLGRMTQRCFPSACGTSGTEIQHWNYANTGAGAGQLSNESDNTTGFSRTVGGYNALGEPTSIEETYNGVPQTLTLGYDSLGRMTSVSYPVSVDGHPLTVDYAYAGSGNLVKVSNANDGTVYWQPQTGAGYPAMNALGQMQAYVLGGGLDIERLHDAATGAVTSITSGPNGSGSVLNLTTSYNASGSRLSLNDLNAGLNESYQYDAFQRLTGVTRTAAGGNSSSGFTYGKAGQFTQGPAGTYAYGSFPAHSPSSTTQNGTTTHYSYNAAGDRIDDGPRLPQVTWNALGRAHTIQTGNGTTLTLTYGPDGGLVNNSGVDGGRYLGAFLKQTDTNDWSARIIVQGRVIAVVKDAGGSISTAYLLQGPLGSTAAVATGGGSLTRRIATGAWGQFVNPATGTGSVNPTTIGATTTVTYTGHELIAGANLINMGARLYDPATGLFMSPDPTVADPYNTQDLNQYAYVNDNPLTYTDPAGLDSGCSAENDCTILPHIIVLGIRYRCPESTVAGGGEYEPYCMTSSEETELFELFTGAGISNFFGGTGFHGGSNIQKQARCTAAEQAAAQLAKSLEHVSTVSATLAAVSGVGTVVSGAGEGPTFGFDTPVTVIFGSMTTFFTGTSFTAGTLAAGLNSFASGNVNALRSFDVSHLAGIAAASVASRIPGVGAWAETVGRLTEQVAGLKAIAQEACH